MEKPGLKEAIIFYLNNEGKERDEVFNTVIYPFLEDIINGVFLSLNITSLSDEDLRDIRSDIYLKVLTRFEVKGLTGIRSTKNYFFISVKHITIDCLRSHNRFKEFKETVSNIITNSKHNEQN